MAGSRLDKIGTIFSRATGLLKSGAIKYQDRPTWYDVYRVFPPKYEPYIEREPERKTGIPDILYKEDKLRADFFKRFGSNPLGEIRRLGDSSSEESSQAFIKKCVEIEKTNRDWSSEQIFNAAAEEYIRSRPAPIKPLRSGTGGDREGSPAPGDGGTDVSVSKNLVKSVDSPSDSHVKREKRTPIVTVESLKALFDEDQMEGSSRKASSESPEKLTSKDNLKKE